MKDIREVKDSELKEVVGGSWKPSLSRLLSSGGILGNGGSNRLHMVLTLPVPKKGDLPSPWEKFPGPYKIYK